MPWRPDADKTCIDCGCGLARSMTGRCRRCALAHRKAHTPIKTWQERIDCHWEPVTETGCWLWTGALASDGYGLVSQRIDGRNICKRAHRLSYELHIGQIPKDMSVLHKCDTPICINPAHLFVGTQKANTDDACRKGRHSHGDRHGHSKLTESDVRSIRADTRSLLVIATDYGVTPGPIYAIKTGRNWRHVKQEQ